MSYNEAADWDDMDDDRDVCGECDGDGLYHDCGEDTCCCANPDDDLITCEHCNGTGYL